MKFFKVQQKLSGSRAKFFLLIFLMAIAVNVSGMLNRESPRERLNNIVISTNDSHVVDTLMTCWYLNFNKFQDLGMDMDRADHKANLKALQAFKNLKAQK